LRGEVGAEGEAEEVSASAETNDKKDKTKERAKGTEEVREKQEKFGRGTMRYRGPGKRQESR
jgi:hypothetical protein